MTRARLVVGLVGFLFASACLVVTPRPPDCGNGRVDGRETDVDCGGSDCPACGDDLVCLQDRDCSSGACTLNRCAAPSCDDGVQNGGETEPDCGGPCDACQAPVGCVTPNDCGQGQCIDGGCVMPSCSNGARDGLETDVDCGGGACPACGAGQTCRRTSDCAAGVCLDGSCRPRCAAPLLECGGTCVDPRVDPQHCGGCSQPCAQGEVCSASQCGATCGGGTQRCGGQCVDTASNPMHCGGCNQPCGMGTTCIGGSCLSPCPPMQTRCGPRCVSLDRDPQHCGSCPNACPMGAGCVGGQCVPGCPAPLTLCGGGASCVDTRNDVMQCGGCNMPCMPRPQSFPACSNSTCLIGVCQPGFADCNGQESDGCEAQLQANPMHCGQCNIACNVGESCMFGSCCGPPPPGVYQATCVACMACNGLLQCQCEDNMQILRPAMIPLNPPCGSGYFNCNGFLQCGAC